jgi:hypothetical protein
LQDPTEKHFGDVGILNKYMKIIIITIIIISGPNVAFDVRNMGSDVVRHTQRKLKNLIDIACEAGSG